MKPGDIFYFARKENNLPEDLFLQWGKILPDNIPSYYKEVVMFLKPRGNDLWSVGKIHICNMEIVNKPLCKLIGLYEYE